MKKQACRKCKMLTDASECPLCHSGQLSTNWKGRMYVLNEKSEIAKKTGMNGVGEYAIKVS